jgi:hypothetical protein
MDAIHDGTPSSGLRAPHPLIEPSWDKSAQSPSGDLLTGPEDGMIGGTFRLDVLFCRTTLEESRN